MLIHLPNLLSLSRILVIPLFVAAFSLPGDWANWVAFGLFVAAGVTDYFDGLIARRLALTSALGRFLDPVADKLLVAAAIMMLVWVDRAPILPALVILCREILVSGLREFLAGIRVSVPVSGLAKWKTAIQITAISFLLVGGAGPALLLPQFTPMAIGTTLLWVAALITLVTGYGYLRKGLDHMVDADDSGSRPAPEPHDRRRRASRGGKPAERSI
ncbi:MAG: CDP-diacylglycerol--glycerol-3-phosphate 3-phosphatidyltransferase [Alphaproteobacteria bacterium]|jgi:cardiolipin synthase|nr:CDP-diacylglycerol--glycerol-3-phosphate 3-phosphatidyltransferase [Alphaproteobacteria bacterium]MDP6515592.1 CDP-diacylglycerol--glycerol-3-phosphate 3-phosphatidyltransferase [Alphaproteobacteria bacterium]|tara:strand:- start:317 stop:964 length:648 start_codon:yes stop_codon:yes gene_type:complete